MNQGIDYDLLAECLKAAMKVEYISNSRELKMYAYALYNAHMWATHGVFLRTPRTTR